MFSYITWNFCHFRELEAQVQDLRAVCKLTSEDRQKIQLQSQLVASILESNAQSVQQQQQQQGAALLSQQQQQPHVTQAVIGGQTIALGMPSQPFPVSMPSESVPANKTAMITTPNVAGIWTKLPTPPSEPPGDTKTTTPPNAETV